MKVKDLIERLRQEDPEMEIYRTLSDDHQHIKGDVSQIIPLIYGYIHSHSKYNKRKYYAFKTKRYGIKILRIIL